MTPIIDDAGDSGTLDGLTPSRKRGRPALDARDVRTQFTLRISADERASWERKAASWEMRLSEWIRYVCQHVADQDDE